jgi:hypothetical protein
MHSVWDDQQAAISKQWADLETVLWEPFRVFSINPGIPNPFYLYISGKGIDYGIHRLLQDPGTG